MFNSQNSLLYCFNTIALTSLSATLVLSLPKSSHLLHWSLLLTGPALFIIILQPSYNKNNTDIYRSEINRDGILIPNPTVYVSCPKVCYLLTFSLLHLTDFLTLLSMKWSLIMGIRASTFSTSRSLGSDKPGCRLSVFPAITLWPEDFLFDKDKTNHVRKHSGKLTLYCFLFVPCSAFADENQGAHNDTGQGNAHTNNDPCHGLLVDVVEVIRNHCQRKRTVKIH